MDEEIDDIDLDMESDLVGIRHQVDSQPCRRIGKLGSQVVNHELPYFIDELNGLAEPERTRKWEELEAIERTGTIALCKWDKLMVTSPRALVRSVYVRPPASW